jgi:diguanylate cyclase (GGDEF)-like protein
VRILIADDDRLSRRVLEKALTAGGYKVVCAEDGSEAWEILQSEDPPRLAILDWMMPGVDGVELCRKVRLAGGPYVYILLLTANADTAAVVLGINAGADDYIKKPFNRDELYARLRTGIRILTLEERLRLQATRDPLTGLANRAAIIELLDVQLSRAQRENSKLGVAMVDIDRFKHFNDTYGHTAGDTILSETARKMRAVLRPYDLIGRYGGEEFILLFPHSDSVQAYAIAERLRSFIASEPVDIGSSHVWVTVSAGVVDSSGFDDSDSVIRAADDALYTAKKNGRNRVESAGRA